MPSSDRQSVYAVVGSDRFLRGEAVEGVLRQVGVDVQDVGAMRFDGSSVELADVLDEVRTPSLLGGRRVAIVDDADAFIKAYRKRLESYCDNPVSGSTLVLACSSLPVTTKLYKAISKRGTVVSCAPPERRAVVGWIVRRGHDKYEKRLSSQTAHRLREHIGDALGMLDAELAKLSVYVGGRREITPADIDALTGQHREEKVFAITDAMSVGDPQRALHHWEQVLATDRAAPGRAIAGLAWSVRRLLQARRDWDAGVSSRELARRMYMDEDVLTRVLERFDVAGIEDQQRDLLEADLAVKTGLSTTERAVEKFIVKHSAGSLPQRLRGMGVTG